MEYVDLDGTAFFKNYHTNDDVINSELCNQIRKSTRPSKEIKMMHSPPEEPVPPNEEVYGLN